MKKVLLFVWLFGVAAIVAAFYREDPAARLAPLLEKQRTAEAAAQCKDWKACCRAWEDALALCPPDDVERRIRIELELAVARIRDEQLARMRIELARLLGEAQQTASGPLVDDVRFAFAKASYDLAWQLRLAGAHPDLWREPATTACQHFRLLAEEAMRDGHARTETYQRCLESAVNLTRVDLSVLAGMPLPPNCWSNSNCENQALRQRDRLNKPKPGEEQKKPSDQDARDKMGEGKPKEGW